MTWNHRVIHRKRNNEDTYCIHEVFYDEDGSISWTEEPVTPFGETLKELKQDIKWFLKACDNPVLEYSDLEALTVEDKDA